MNLKEEVIQLKLQKANAYLAEVEVLMKNQFYSSAVNRLYYGCFTATNALLLVQDLTPKTHSGTITLLNEHFVKAGLFDKEKATFIANLLRLRITEDYSDYLISDKAEVDKLINPSKDYVATIEKLIENLHR